MILFKNTGIENTESTIEMAVGKATELGCDIVISSSTGYSAEILLNMAERMDYHGSIIVVRHASSAKKNGGNDMSHEIRDALKEKGALVVTAAHALSAGERGLSSNLQGVYPLEIMAHTLRTFGQGTKVAFECAVMALDADAIKYNEPVVSIGGSSRGVDTAVVITPSYSATILETKIHEFICKPSLL